MSAEALSATKPGASQPSCTGSSALEQVQRHVQGHAVIIGTRLEAVVQWQARLAQWQVLRVAPVRCPHPATGRPVTSAGSCAVPAPAPSTRYPALRPNGSAAAPGPGTSAPASPRGHDARAAQLLPPRGRPPALSGCRPRSAGVDLAGHQRLAHEDVVRLARCDAASAPAFRCQHQAEQADLLGGQHLAPRARPVRVEVLRSSRCGSSAMTQSGSIAARVMPQTFCVSSRLATSNHGGGRLDSAEPGNGRKRRWRGAWKSPFSVLPDLRRQARHQRPVQGQAAARTRSLKPPPAGACSFCARTVIECRQRFGLASRARRAVQLATGGLHCGGIITRCRRSRCRPATAPSTAGLFLPAQFHSSRSGGAARATRMRRKPRK